MGTPKTKEPTLQEIADRSGFARSTVSLALRNHPSLPQNTRDAIRAVAEEMGYRPNPLISALMTQMRDKRTKKRECLAVITRFHHPISKAKQDYPVRLHEAITGKADSLGFDIDEFYTDPANPMSSKRMSDILIARGIHGVLFFPGNTNPSEDYPELDWKQFACVIIGFNTRRIALHQVCSDYTYDMDLALNHICQAGEARIGYAVSVQLDQLTNYNWSSRYLLYQSRIPARKRLPIFYAPEIAMERAPFMQWFLKTKPEVTITTSPSVISIRQWLTEEGYDVPRDVRLVNLLKRNESDIAGINPHTREVGRAAVELLASLLQTNQFGLPEFPKTISIKGHWYPGSSFPD